MKKNILLVTIVHTIFFFPFNAHASSYNPCIIEKEDKIAARNHFETLYAYNIARNSLYEIDEKDLEVVKEKPTSRFAEGIYKNPNFKATPELLNFIKEDSKEKIVSKIVDKSFIPQEKDKKIARDSPDTDFAFELAKNPNLKIDSTDIEFAHKNINSKFTLGLIQNPRYPFSELDKMLARTNPDSNFAICVALHRHIILENSDKVFSRENPNTKYTELIVRNKSYNIDVTDKEVMKTFPNSGFTSGLISNTSFMLDSKDINFIRKNPGSVFAQLVKNPDYKIESRDKEIAYKYFNTDFALLITQNPSFIINKDDVSYARKNPKSKFAENLLQNRNYKIEKKDKEIARKLPASNFAYGLSIKLLKCNI